MAHLVDREKKPGSRRKEKKVLAMAPAAFDYSKLGEEQRTVLMNCAEAINRHNKLIGLAVINMGHKLIEAKATFKHGKWGAWIKAALPFTEKTAQRYMKIAEVLGPSSDILSEVSVSVLSAIAEAPLSVQEVILGEIERKKAKPTIKAVRARSAATKMSQSASNNVGPESAPGTRDPSQDAHQAVAGTDEMPIHGTDDASTQAPDDAQEEVLRYSDQARMAAQFIFDKLETGCVLALLPMLRDLPSALLGEAILVAASSWTRRRTAEEEESVPKTTA